jgi:hypothetical protein
LAIGRFVILDLVLQSYAEKSYPKPPETTRFGAGGFGRGEVQKCKNPVFHGVFQVPPDGLEPSTL